MYGTLYIKYTDSQLITCITVSKLVAKNKCQNWLQRTKIKLFLVIKTTISGFHAYTYSNNSNTIKMIGIQISNTAINTPDIKDFDVGECSVQSSTEIAATLNKIGNHQYEEGDYDGALSAYKQGLEIELEVLDGLHPNIIITLTNIGEIYKIRGEYQEALRVHKEAFKIQCKRLGKSHPDLCSTLLSVAAIHYDAQNYGKARKTYERVLQIQRDACGDHDDLDVASTLFSMGLVLFKMEYNEHALHAFEESLKIRKELLDKDHIGIASILYNIGAVYLETGDDDTALSYYKETHRVERAALGNYHEDITPTLEHIGHLYEEKGDINEAIKYFSDALDIYKTNSESAEDESSKRDDDISIAQTLNNIGNLYLQKGQTQDMVTEFSDAIRYLQKSGKSYDDLAICGFDYYALSKLHPECASVA